MLQIKAGIGMLSLFKRLNMLKVGKLSCFIPWVTHHFT